jgi:hypothetical protein
MWESILKYDPIQPLLSSENEAVVFFAERDLVGKSHKNIQLLWELPDAQKIVRKQQRNGSWKYPGGNKSIRSAENYAQLETYRNLAYLVEMFGFNNSSIVISNAIAFLFQFQTDHGDIRGILGSQYMPYYTAAMLELFIKAGYINDNRIERAFSWLASVRQDDGGWAIPLRTRNKKLDIIAMKSKTLEPDYSKPFSHMVTGVVLRAYAAHPEYKNSEIAKQAGRLLLSNFFKKDNYPDRANAYFWLRFTFPFWFTDLISALDSLSRLGFSKDEPQMEKAIKWLTSRQQKNGLWKLKALKNPQYNPQLWLSLSICRILKRLYT